MASDTDTGATELTHGTGGNPGQVAGRSDQGKNILHTIDPKMLMVWGNVLAFGARKYHQRNFMVAPGMEWSRVYDSLQRHLLAFWGGEWLDPESGEPHIGHVLCNLQFLWAYHENAQYHPGDDRPSSVEMTGRRWEDWKREFDSVRAVHTALDAAEAKTAEGDPIEQLMEAATAGAEAIIARIRDPDDRINAQARVRDPSFFHDPLRAHFSSLNRNAR